MKLVHIVLAAVTVVALAACAAGPGPARPANALPEPAITPAATAAPAAPGTPYPGPNEGQEKEPYPGPGAGTPEAYPGPAAGQNGQGQAARWTFDGAITEGEYDGRTTIGPITVYWAHDGQLLYIAAEAETAGWLGIGLDPDDRMQGADFIIAVHDGQPQIWDAWGVGRTGATHPPDTEIGGTFDILEYAVARDGGWLRLEALRPLISSDPNDKSLSPGQVYAIIVGIGSSSAFDAPHVFRGRGEMALE